jgi:hypothetical protein
MSPGLYELLMQEKLAELRRRANRYAARRSVA